MNSQNNQELENKLPIAKQPYPGERKKGWERGNKVSGYDTITKNNIDLIFEH